MSKAKRRAEETYKLLTTPPNPADVAAYYNAALVKLQEAYIKGYKQAEKDTIERVCKWLSRHYDIDLVSFRKAILEEEQ